MTAQDLIHRSLTLAGRLGAGRTAGQSESTVALGILNAMLDGWNTIGLIVYAIRDDTYTLTGEQQDYLIGPGAADFNTARPAFIERANILLEVGDGGDIVKKPVDLINAAGWSEISTPADLSILPKKLYCDYQIPVAKLRFYPIPSADVDLELFTWEQLGGIGALEEVVTFPAAYERAVVYGLAVELTGAFDLPLREDVAGIAQSARADIANLNAMRRGITPAAPEVAA